MIDYKIDDDSLKLTFIQNGHRCSLSINKDLFGNEKVSLIIECINSIKNRLGRKANIVDTRGKQKYLDCVYLKNTEKEKLIERLGNDKFYNCIEILNNYKMSNGKIYKSDYHAMLNWVINRVEQGKTILGHNSKRQMTAEEFNESLRNNK